MNGTPFKPSLLSVSLVAAIGLASPAWAQSTAPTQDDPQPTQSQQSTYGGQGEAAGSTQEVGEGSTAVDGSDNDIADIEQDPQSNNASRESALHRESRRAQEHRHEQGSDASSGAAAAMGAAAGTTVDQSTVDQSDDDIADIERDQETNEASRESALNRETRRKDDDVTPPGTATVEGTTDSTGAATSSATAGAATSEPATGMSGAATTGTAATSTMGSVAGSNVQVTSSLPDSVVGDYSIDFAELDKNGDGALSRAEARGNETLLAEFRGADMNKDGKLSKDELKGWIQ